MARVSLLAGLSAPALPSPAPAAAGRGSARSLFADPCLRSVSCSGSLVDRQSGEAGVHS